VLLHQDLHQLKLLKSGNQPFFTIVRVENKPKKVSSNSFLDFHIFKIGIKYLLNDNKHNGGSEK
jgi:hypothetical protein